MGRTRYAGGDPCIHVAVVGEVGSGKTTLINALVGQRLLPTSAVACTHCAVRIRYGRQPSAAFRPLGGSPVSHPTEAFWTALRDLWPGARPGSLSAAVALLVGHPGAGDRVDAVHVDSPSRFLGQGVVLIDTPGTNADDDRQAEIVRDVVSKEADVVAVVVSALAPVTRTLAEFLPVTVTHRARRTAVVSHVDLIEARDRNLVLRSVRRRLDLAGMDDAPVFPAAAVVASGGRSLTDLAAGPGTAPRRVEEAVARRALRWAVDLDRRLGCRPSARQVSGVLAELRQLNTLARAWTADELDRYDADLPAVTSLLHRLASGAEPPSPFHVRLALAAAPWAAVTDARAALQTTR